MRYSMLVSMVKKIQKLIQRNIGNNTYAHFCFRPLLNLNFVNVFHGRSVFIEPHHFELFVGGPFLTCEQELYCLHIFCISMNMCISAQIVTAPTGSRGTVPSVSSLGQITNEEHTTNQPHTHPTRRPSKTIDFVRCFRVSAG